MGEAFLALSPDARREALQVAAAASGRPPHLLEKDVWVVWALEALFAAPFAGHLVFKGGTSLSKAFGLIRRFSEDVDLTYDIRALLPDLAGDASDTLPANPSQARKWVDAVHDRLPRWIAREVIPAVERRLHAEGLNASVVQEDDQVRIRYPAVEAGTGYVGTTVLLEFGARSTGEPCEPRTVACDAAPFLADLAFPGAVPRTMNAERTFWEKATAAHVYCLRGEFRGGQRYARHWHDLVRLHDAGVAAAAIADKALGQAVAAHKQLFFRERDADGEWIDYDRAVSGSLRLTPEGAAREALALDYAAMVTDGLLLDDAPAFEWVMERMREIETLSNRVRAQLG